MAQPGRMRGVVGQVITGDAVYQHIQSVAVLVEPGNEAVKLRTVKGQLTTPVRVRAHFAFMHAAHGHPEPLAGLPAKLARLRHRVRAEIDVGMVVGVQVFGSWRCCCG